METRREDSEKILSDIGNSHVAFYLQETTTDDISIDLIESKHDDGSNTDAAFYLQETATDDRSIDLIESKDDNSSNTDVAFYLQETATDDISIDLIEAKDDDSSIEEEIKVDLITIIQQTPSEQEQESKSQNETDVSFYLEEGFNDNSAEFIENEEDPVQKIASSSRRIDMDGAIRHKIVLYSEMKEDESIKPTSRQAETEDFIGTKISTPFDRDAIQDEKPHPASKIRLRKEPTTTPTPQVTRESVETIFERRKASTTQCVVDMNDTACQTNVVATAPNTTKATHRTPTADIAEPVGCGCGLFRSRRRS
jgi:hypothetical protein